MCGYLAYSLLWQIKVASKHYLESELKQGPLIIQAKYMKSTWILLFQP